MRHFRKTLPPGHASRNGLFKNYRASAFKRGFDFELTAEEFARITQLDCTYCGSPPSNPGFFGGSTTPYIHNGIDRVDSSQGYVLGNCVPCCKNCNIMKGVLPSKVFLEHVEKIAIHSEKQRKKYA